MRPLFLIPALLLAQDPTIRVSTRLVQLNVLVRDSHGPVPGLTKKDFKIFDKGKEQQIALFNVSAVSSKPDAIIKTPPGVFTNRPKSATETPAGATVLLIDVLNTEVADQQTAQKQILKFLATLDPNRRVAIYLLTAKSESCRTSPTIRSSSETPLPNLRVSNPPYSLTPTLRWSAAVATA
jgi:VWFA-related protein